MLLLLWFGVLIVMSPSGIPLIGLGAIGVFLALAVRTLLLKVVANESGLLVATRSEHGASHGTR
jgi:hypothetical protein